MTQPPIYHPLSGDELLKWILHSITENLGTHYMFTTSQAYHNPKFKLTLELETYSAEAKFLTDSKKIEVAAEKLNAPAMDRALKKLKKDFEITIKEPALEPDKVRDSIGEPRYETTKIGDVLVDAKIKKEDKKSEPK